MDSTFGRLTFPCRTVLYNAFPFKESPLGHHYSTRREATRAKRLGNSAPTVGMQLLYLKYTLV